MGDNLKLLEFEPDTEDYSKYTVDQLIETLKTYQCGKLEALEAEICRRLKDYAQLDEKPYAIRLTESGVFLELHRNHIEPLLEVVRAEKHRTERYRNTPRTDLFREIEFRLNQAAKAVKEA